MQNIPKIKKSLLTLIAVLFILTTSKAQNDGMKYIDRNDLMSYMKFLASDDLKGRETGREENDIAASFIAANLMRFGVKPIPGTDSYLQNIPFTSKTVDKSASVLSATGETEQPWFQLIQ